MTETPAPLLFFTSRSAFERQVECQRKRYLGNHWGPRGYGLQPSRQSIPLATGQRTHEIFQPVLQYCVEHDQLPPAELIGRVCVEAVENYQAAVADKGLSYWGTDSDLQRLVTEQENLIAGLPMLWFLHRLPVLLQDWRIVLAEPREVSVYACTCGLGDGIPPWQVHVERGCEGIGLMTGPDFIAQHRYSGSYRYDEFKTRSAQLTDAWAESYETRVQVQLGTLGIEQKLGIQVDQVYLHGLWKGQRRQSTAIGGEYQDSVLCWPWCKKGSPPLSDDEWAYAYEWWDEQENRSRRLGKGFERRWVGEYPGGLPAFIQTLPDHIVAKIVRTVGPLQRNPVAKADALDGWIEQEIRNRSNLYEIYAALETNRFDWTAPQVRKLLNRHFPQSWDCQKYGARYACEFKPICHHSPGWQDPYSIGFVDRRPHHQAELDQAVARGLAPADDVWEGDE